MNKRPFEIYLILVCAGLLSFVTTDSAGMAAGSSMDETRVALTDRGAIAMRTESHNMNFPRIANTPDRPLQPKLASELRIRDLYELAMLPQLVRLKRAKATLSDYRTSVKKWEEFWQSGGRREPDVISGTQQTFGFEPAASAVTRQDLRAFADWYHGGGEGSAAVTVNRRVGLLVAILDTASDEDDLDFASTCKAPKRLPATVAKAKVVLSIDHVNAIYQACDVADWPIYKNDRSPLDALPADYWRALVVMLFNYGARLQDFAAYDTARSPLRWRGDDSGVSFDAESPASDATSPHGWLWFVPTKTQATKGQPLVLPMPLVVRQHLEQIRGDGEGLVFPFPCNRNLFAETRRKIFAAAGVSPKVAIAKRDYYLPSDFRKTCLTFHQRACRGIGPFVTGHADQARDRVLIADRHYDNAEYALADHFKTFEQPSSFGGNCG